MPIADELQISPAVARLRDRLVAVRRDLHQHPEAAFQEVRTAGIVETRLRELGYQVKAGVAQTGVVGDTGEGKKTLLLRFDMDALPITEATGASYASHNPGWMHACGHDGHTSIGLGVAELLRSENIAGGIKLVFQPAEESPGGAKPMIDAGVLRNPDVDACLGLHLWNELPVGTVGLRSGPVMADTALFSIRIKGKGGHGAAPHQTADALVAAAHLVLALQTIVSRNVDPQSPAVVTVGEFYAGSAHNIIAEEAFLRGTIRSFDDGVRELIFQRVEAIASATARALGASAEVSLERGYPAVVNDEKMTDLVRQAASEVVGRDRVVAAPPSMGGEDMAYFLREKPGCFFFVGSANPSRSLSFPHHNPRFDFDEDALQIGAEIMIRAARRFFEQKS